ncbi:hypothetical protein BKA00_007453 [Actinomadura coerulea]|uniref:Uncharacterized protein n=1 Tax=Actinomadura coerulea TaxID=46159 RepID=A0A7X0G6U8_9ACTN|nr:hypothetical protein [Actinomadura coerulea]MBB6400539.1 hypothetical protein [Actinomadura coerulea]GGQ07966.1 hypothetical protein GCM10010187_25080 [Actinomadura coerulea]
MTALTSNAIERLVREALELHRLVKAAEEVQHLRSPATGVEKNGKGASDPTASAAMCPKRLAVVETLTTVHHAVDLMADEINTHAHYASAALNAWDGRKP